MTEASSFQCLLVNFSSMFTHPSRWTFMTLANGWVLCTGRRTISRVIQLGCFGEEQRHHCICIQTPWNENRWMAIPVAFRLYRSKKLCPKEKYRKRTELAREMIEEIDTWIPQDRSIILVGDTEYACREVVRGLPKRIVFVGPMSMDAALFEPPPATAKGRGRPRRKGKRLLSPKQLIAAEHIPWKPHEMMLYGKMVTVMIKTQTCLWYTVASGRLVRMIVTRDPSGRIEDRAYFSTDAEMSVEEIARSLAAQRTRRKSGHPHGSFPTDRLCARCALLLLQRYCARRCRASSSSCSLVSRQNRTILRRHARRAQTSSPG